MGRFAAEMLKRIAGVLIPLFSLRTTEDFGRGEIRALVPMADFALAMGHRMIQLLPIDETAPGETSPYSAMSVLAIDPRYILGARAIRDCSRRYRGRACGCRAPESRRSDQATSGQNRSIAQIVRSFRRKRQVPGERSACARNLSIAIANGSPIYSLFRALKEKFGWSEWASWPDGLDRRAAGAVEIAALGTG